jgi:methanogenic corrinoid protein MtbC1
MWESGAVPEVFARSRPTPGIAAKAAATEPAKLARLLIAGRDEALRGEISQRLASGTPRLVIMNEVLPPIAREIGRLWDNDESDLIDAQRAFGALKRWIGELASETDAPVPAISPSILMQVAPGERHTLGVDMAEAVFRGLGWRVARGEARGFGADLANEWRDVLGFSLSCDRNIEALAKAIVEARAASRNARLLVVVGGPIFSDRPDIAKKIGADFCAPAAEITVQWSDALLNGSPMSLFFNKRC